MHLYIRQDADRTFGFDTAMDMESYKFYLGEVFTKEEAYKCLLGEPPYDNEKDPYYEDWDKKELDDLRQKVYSSFGQYT